MNLRKAWTIALKDLTVLRRKKGILYSLVAFPLGIGLGLPAVLAIVVRRQTATYAQLLSLADAFAFFFIIGVVVLSTSLASYSIVGEKVERSLEPLLATPTEDGEILLGKTIGAFLPTVLATLLGATIFMVFIDVLSHQELGYFYYPNWSIAAFLLAAMPLACLMAVEMNVIISARISDVRTAQQAGALLVMPFVALYVLGEINVLTLDARTILIVSAILLVVDLLLFPVSRATFRREEILTKWK